MGFKTFIEWCHHTFNPWVGCTKVSLGCKFCFAERDMDHRRHFVKWGPGGLRRRTSEQYWKQPLKWDQDAASRGVRERVFCASLADVFEDVRPELTPWRLDLFDLIRQTPNLDWLLLTKRPQEFYPILTEVVNLALLLRKTRQDDSYEDLIKWLTAWAAGSPPENVWMGTSVEDQDAVNKRVPELLKIWARVRFLSVEPLLDGVNITKIPFPGSHYKVIHPLDGLWSMPDCDGDYPSIHWVICGGESGSDARPMTLSWARSVRDQCASAGIPFLFKQWGEWCPTNQLAPSVNQGGRKFFSPPGDCVMLRVGKKAAGRSLDGRTHDEYPEAA